MLAPDVRQATAAAVAIGTSLGLMVGAAVVLNNSNKLTLRLLPCDVVARVAPKASQSAQFEIQIAQQLMAAGGPVGALEPRVAPRVYERGDFVVTLWTYYERATSSQVSPPEYAGALLRMHAGMRALDVSAPHFMERVDSARLLLTSKERTPALDDADRKTLADTVHNLGPEIREYGDEQLLHGEPHPGNLLATKNGPLFIDLETCCRGPIEFDLAHAPEEVSDYYPGVNHDVLRKCRLLVLAMITTWRWDRDDLLPNGRQLRTEWLSRLRAGLGRHIG